MSCGQWGDLRSDPWQARSGMQAGRPAPAPHKTRMSGAGGREPSALVIFRGFYFLVGLTWQFSPDFSKLHLFPALRMSWEKSEPKSWLLHGANGRERSAKGFMVLSFFKSNSVCSIHIQLKRVLNAQKDTQLKAESLSLETLIRSSNKCPRVPPACDTEHL